MGAREERILKAAREADAEPTPLPIAKEEKEEKEEL
jgi:hypothetical protein